MKKNCLIYGTPSQKLPFGYDEEDELCIAIKLKIAEVVSQLAANGISDFLTDCEYGIPLWGAEIVLAQKILTPEITLKVYMPHEEQAVNWTPDWRKRYFEIHKKADRVVIFNDYAKCFKALCNDTDMLIYVGNDEAEIVKCFYYSGKMVKRIIII